MRFTDVSLVNDEGRNIIYRTVVAMLRFEIFLLVGDHALPRFMLRPVWRPIVGRLMNTGDACRVAALRFLSHIPRRGGGQR